MNRQLHKPESLKSELDGLEHNLTGTERIMLRRKMAKLIVIDGKAYFIDMVMTDKGGI